MSLVATLCRESTRRCSVPPRHQRASRRRWRIACTRFSDVTAADVRTYGYAGLFVCAMRAFGAADESPRDDEPIEASETIIIEDLRRLRPPTYDPASVTVLERKELEARATVSSDDLVRIAPSVAMFRRSGSLVADPSSQGVNLRGLGPSGVSRTLVLRDGIPLNDPFGGWIYWRAIPLHSIERVEIQPSGASSLFGNFGLGGVMNLTSRPITDQTIEARVAGGSHETMIGAARTSDRLGPLGIELDGELMRSDGFTPIALHDRGAVDHPAASSHRDAGVRIELARDRETLRGFARFFDQSLDSGTLHTTADVRAVSYGATARIERGQARIDVAGFGGNQRFEQTRARVSADRATAAPVSSQQTPSNNQGASAAITLTSGDHTFQAGADTSRVTGTATDTLFPAMPTDTSTIERAAGGEQRFLGVFGQASTRAVPDLELGAALRLDAWQNRDASRRLERANGEIETVAFDDRTDTELSPRLGVLHHASEHVALRASVYRAFRAPTLNELYRPFQVGTVMTSANEDLVAESLWGAELGPQLVVGPLVARATAFSNRVDDPIFNATIPTDDGSIARMRQNLGQARIAGLELETTWRPTAAWSFTVAYTFMTAEVTSAPDHPDLAGKRLAQVPHHRALASIGYDAPSLISLVADVRFTSPQFEDDLNTLAMDAYTVVDLHARRPIAYGLSAFASAQNLFDRSYLVGRAGIDTIGQPRTILAGLAFTTR
jgi:iron complex outermembrane receptor protein